MVYRHTVACRVAQGYRLAIEEANLLSFETCLRQTWDVSANAKAIRAVLADPATRPTAIFALGDFRLVLAHEVIRELGLKVPDDLALVGYYNNMIAEHFEVPLTSVSIREDELARIAAERIVSGNGHRESILVKPTLIVRKSCGANKSG